MGPFVASPNRSETIRQENSILSLMLCLLAMLFDFVQLLLKLLEYFFQDHIVLPEFRLSGLEA